MLSCLRIGLNLFQQLSPPALSKLFLFDGEKILKYAEPAETSKLLIQGIEVNLPQTDTTKMSVQNEPLVISIDKNGNYFINVGDESLSIDLEELKRKSKVIFDANPEVEVVFQNDKDVAFEYVAKAMASIQSIGISNIGIVTSGYEN